MGGVLLVEGLAEGVRLPVVPEFDWGQLRKGTGWPFGRRLHWLRWWDILVGSAWDWRSLGFNHWLFSGRICLFIKELDAEEYLSLQYLRDFL